MGDEIKTKNKNGESTSEKLRKNRTIVPTALQYKHPLEFEWTLWYFENNKQRDWNENQREVYTFSTVEDFWSLFVHIRPVAELRNGCDYSIFKKGIKPMWEDARNKRGGRWLITLEKRGQRNGNLDSYWLELLLLMIGGSLEGNKNDLCGAVINIRPKADKISVWTGDGENTEGIRGIGSVMREGLNLPHNIVIGYQAHTDNINKSNSSVKNRLVA